jgi:DNA polymerase III epsilon subunit-like protein
MIILDIETTGLTNDCGICEIGAINTEHLSNTFTFLQDCRIDEEDTITEGALRVNGRSLEVLKDKNKQSQKELITNYLDWVEKQEEKVFYGQNVAWDITMIQSKSIKYGLHKKFLDIHGQRGMDLHTLTQEKYFKIHNKYFLNEKGQSAFNLGESLKFCGIPDGRVNVKGNETIKEGKFHTALEDCVLEGEVLYRLKFGKTLFDSFREFPIPDYLKK